MDDERKGARVKTVEDLYALAFDRKSVIGKYCIGERPIPATVVLNMTGVTILKMISSGLYEYVPKPKGQAGKGWKP